MIIKIYEKIQRIEKAKEKMHPPKKKKKIHKLVKELYSQVEKKYDRISRVEARYEEYRRHLEKLWFSRTKRQIMELNQTFPRLLKVPYPPVPKTA